MVIGGYDECLALKEFTIQILYFYDSVHILPGNLYMLNSFPVNVCYIPSTFYFWFTLNSYYFVVKWSLLP